MNLDGIAEGEEAAGKWTLRWERTRGAVPPAPTSSTRSANPRMGFMAFAAGTLQGQMKSGKAALRLGRVCGTGNGAGSGRRGHE